MSLGSSRIYKSLTLELYNQEVKVIFISGTECFKKYGQSLVGQLLGRIWGERFDDATTGSTVIGIMLKTPDEEINITCTQIENIERAT